MTKILRRIYIHATLAPPPSFETKHKGASGQTSCHQVGHYVLLMVARSSPVLLIVKLECGQLDIPFSAFDGHRTPKYRSHDTCKSSIFIITTHSWSLATCDLSALLLHA